MNLPFSHKLKDGTPTNFAEKIWSCLIQDDLIPDLFMKIDNLIDEYHISLNRIKEFDPKKHSIRRGYRWHEGMKIHAIYFNRTKKRFQFAPIFICTGVQDIFMTIDNGLEISIDDQYFYCNNWGQLAHNDGLSRAQFVDFFYRDIEDKGDLSGQIIHWTDLRY